MPQMSPLWWEILFIFFIMTFMFMIMIIFFNKNIQPKSLNQKEIETHQFKWKW
uniref:ATP synthase F0 subunit 8 n=1 Tax=Homoeocerus dilatatus TaxID=763216 RepID=UPI002A7F5AF1|nr:ATP synthase F0 subunit 8 [Homoeocerus dilatatus]WOZ13994.1 ATP synthase F0 subunit 8 [Homoeocerus dilatatus]